MSNPTITDKDWKVFCLWWDEHYHPSMPHRASVEKYLEWRQNKDKNPNFNWKKESHDEQVS